MADSVIEGFLGGEPEEPAAAEALQPFDSADALAAALAVESAETEIESGARSDARAYLQAQKALVDLQVRYFEVQRRLARDERLLAIDAAKRKRFADRLKNTIQLLATLAALVIAAAVIVLLTDAIAARSVVVDPFRTPPALAPRGVNGEVVASGLLDELQKLQNATRSSARGMQARNAWSSDIRIEVPQTGMSVGEIDRLLRQRLGHDLHISGDLIQTDGGGLQLTVRGDRVPGQTFAGAQGDLGKLTRQAAEYVYGRSQPVQFATYLAGAGRNAEALAFLPGAFARADDDETRARLANIWGAAFTGQNRPAEAVAKFRLAMTLKHHFWSAWANLVGALQAAYGEEPSWREAGKLLRAADDAPAAQKPELRMLATPAGSVWDLPLFLAANLQDATHNAGTGANANIVGPQIADIYGLMHDPMTAARYLAQSDPADPETKVEALLLPAYAALDRGDAVAAAAPLKSYWKAWLAGSDLQFTQPDLPCVAGLAFGLAGLRADAEAVFARVGPWSRCYAARGDMLERAGDLGGAQQVWSEGLRVAPDLPFVFLHRGLSELRRGDFAHAGADLAVANARAPHFADPLKAWGDLLAREGRWRQALAKYDQALAYAPAWAELRQAQAVAAARAE
ncbi:MAG TPA: tetratricopeptide repeat protein [Caulobacteraceae bacterium]|nr:tetratricopeptide repeat protein [Caulobacteraceae bacterium]